MNKKLPVQLPRFTFFFGPPGGGQEELAKRLSAEDQCVLVEEFEEPLRNVALALFFNNNIMGNDLRQKEVREKFVLNDPRHGMIATFIARQKRFLEQFYGADILGHLAYNAFMGDIPADRYIYLDGDVGPILGFTEKLRRKSCLILSFHLEKLLPTLLADQDFKHIPLGGITTDQRMERLHQELDFVMNYR